MSAVARISDLHEVGPDATAVVSLVEQLLHVPAGGGHQDGQVGQGCRCINAHRAEQRPVHLLLLGGTEAAGLERTALDRVLLSGLKGAARGGSLRGQLQRAALGRVLTRLAVPAQAVLGQPRLLPVKELAAPILHQVQGTLPEVQPHAAAGGARIRIGGASYRAGGAHIRIGRARATGLLLDAAVSAAAGVGCTGGPAGGAL